jgi:uncharacterized protein
MAHDAIRETFTAALDALVAQLRTDRSILAAILCGSLSHDTVWARSDIDLVLVTIDDKKVDRSDASLYADGVNVHAILMPRTEFRKIAESATHNSFAHSLLAKGRLLYTHDETIQDLCARLCEIGERDVDVQLLRAGNAALSTIYKAHKWFITRQDLDYTALWILYAATPLAQIEVMSAGLLVDREVVPQALALNPGFFQIVYSRLLNAKKTTGNVREALEAVDGYLAERTPRLFKLVFDHLRDVGEARSCTEIEAHFVRHFGTSSVTTACEYLADKGLLGKAAISGRLTRKSNVDVQELAFFYVSPTAEQV